MPTRKQPRTPPGAKRDQNNRDAKTAGQVIAENLAGKLVGRPPKYHPSFCHIAETACIINAESPMLAEMFGAGQGAIFEWIEKFPDFGKAIKQGKEYTDNLVEKSLIHRAKGYSHPEKVFMSVSDGAAVGSHIETIETTKHYPPDPTSMIFWLKNRKPKEWRPDTNLQPIGAASDDAARQLREQMAAMDDSTEGKE